MTFVNEIFIFIRSLLNYHHSSFKSKCCVLGIFFGLMGAILFVPSPSLSVTEARAEYSLSALEDRFGWEIRRGDWIYADISTNQMWFVRADESQASQPFDIGSGYDDGRTVHWLGMAYDPITPEEQWMIRTKHIQGTCWVFCGNRPGNNDQTFLRLWRLNENSGKYEYSHYGVHSTPNFDAISTQMEGFGSWGCVLADYDLLKFAEEMFDYHQAFGEGIRVVTSRST
jgi:hypothetical protein